MFDLIDHISSEMAFQAVMSTLKRLGGLSSIKEEMLGTFYIREFCVTPDLEIRDGIT